MRYRAEVDGLRAVAVVPVVLFHAGFGAFAGGYVGVDVFFVISGYLITSIILEDLRNGTFTFRRFYERRVRRILPALFVVIAACVPFAWMWMTPSFFGQFADSVVAVMLFSSNVLFWLESGYFGTAAELIPLLHTWSLAIEEQFYVVFPVFLLISYRYFRSKILVCILLGLLGSLALAEYASFFHAKANFFLLPMRGWELLAGAALAHIEHSRGRAPTGTAARALAVLGLVMIAVAVATFDTRTRHPGLITLLPVVGTALVIWYGDAGGVATRLLSAAPVVLIGLMSYSFYLWHQPIFAFARIRFGDDLSTWAYAGMIALSAALSFATLNLVEQPARNRRLISARAIFGGAGTVSGTLIVCGAVAHLGDGLPQRFSPEAAAIFARPSLAAYRSFMQDGKMCHERSPENACVVGARGADRPHVAIWGDSHAATLMHSLDRELRSRGVSAYQFTLNGCIPVFGAHAEDRADTAACDAFNRRVRELVETRDIDTIVIAGRFAAYLYGTGFDNGEGRVEAFSRRYVPIEDFREETRVPLVLGAYTRSLVEMPENVKKIVLVYPIPETGFRVPDALAWTFEGREEWQLPITTEYGRYKDRTREVAAAFDAIQDPRIARIRPDELLCDTFVPGRCATHRDATPFYDDDDHLSQAGADLIVPSIVDALGLDRSASR